MRAVNCDIAISVIVPAYNAGNHITRCLESLLCQTSESFEIIVVDDGSTDNTSVLAENILAASPVKSTLLKQKHEGVSRARNFGLEKAAGRYIYFLDSDDTIDESALEKLLSTAVVSGSDCVICGLKKVDETKKVHWCSNRCGFPNEDSLSADELLPLLMRNRVHFRVGSVLFSRDTVVANKLHFTNGCTNGEDTEFFLKMFFHSKKVSFVHEELLTIYAMKGTASRSASLKLFHSVGSMRRLHKYLLQHGVEEETARYLLYRRIPQTYVQIIRALARMGIGFRDYLAIARNGQIRKQLKSFEKFGNEKSDRSAELEVKTLLRFPVLYFLYIRLFR